MSTMMVMVMTIASKPGKTAINILKEGDNSVNNDGHGDDYSILTRKNCYKQVKER